MPAHPVLDNSKTWTYLLEHKPRDLKEFISGSPQQFDLEYAVRRFTDRSVGAVNESIGNTNFKAQFKIILAFWRGIADWKEAYRWDVAMIDADARAWFSPSVSDDARDWRSFYLKIDRKFNGDVLVNDGKQAELADCPLFGGAA